MVDKLFYIFLTVNKKYQVAYISPVKSEFRVLLE
jgi:hypothetical protein